MSKNSITIKAGSIDKALDILSNAVDRAGQKSIEIRGAKIKDDFCNYSYELKDGPTAGDTLSRNGAHIIHNDLREKFDKLGVHLAVKCEEIDAKKIKDIDSIEKYDDSIHREGGLEHRVSHFSVLEFRIDGTGEKEGVTLIGEKRLTTGEFVKLSTPKISWEGDYQFINELRVAVDDCIEEVEQYMNGKTAPKLVQSSMEFGEEGGEGSTEE